MQSLSPEKLDFFWVLANRIVPESTELDAAGRGRFFAIIDNALFDRPATVRRQFATFLGLIRSAPLIRYGKSFENLTAGRQDAVLHWFEDCPVGLLRKGFWGLKAMVFMGYYGQPETNELVGYAPDLDGGQGSVREVDYDIVIIGSGTGGGVAAKELAPLCADGKRIAVLEWGAKLREEEFTGREVDMASKLFFDSGGTFTEDRAMTLAYGRAYGGSTVIYTGTSLVMPENVVEQWSVPGLEFTDLHRRSMKYFEENNVHLLADEEINDNNRLFLIGCQELGYNVEQFPINTKGCRGSSLCNLGCPNQAKQGTDRVQLPVAEEQGVEVITNCRVTRLGDQFCEALVEDPGYGHPSKWEPGEYRVKARVVVVCAGGVVNSPALLLRSGFGDHLPMIGRSITLHPALILVGEHENRITNFHGFPKSYYCDQFMKREKFLLETCMYFPFVTAKNLIGFGAEHSELMRAFPRLQMILVLALDPALPENRVTLNAQGDPVVTYTLTDPVLDTLHASMQASAKVFFAAGAKRVHAPAGTNFFIDAADADRVDELIPRANVKPGKISITSAHLMGGCAMGRDPSDSVTDGWGRVHGVPWLYVADSSLFPQCSGVNPYVTVMALADRVAEGIRKDTGELLA